MTTLDAPLERTTLYYRDNRSDKIYMCAIEPSGAGFIVTFAYGRRGSTLQTGTKTAQPVAYAAAKKIYDKLVQEKTAKGYTPGEDGTPYQQTENAQRATGVLPQLLNAIDESAAEKLLTDPAWLTQEKLDGKRVILRRSGDAILGINRKGLEIPLPEPIVACARTISGQQWLLDGECVGDVFIAFDLLEMACVDLRPQPYRKRLDALYGLALTDDHQPIRFIRTAVKTADKRSMLADLRMQNRVGVGNVTIPAGTAIPAAGSIAEVRYLYAYPGGSLFQPVYLGERDDIAVDACVLGQLKYKTSDESDG